MEYSKTNEVISSVEQLEEKLSEPTSYVIETLAKMDGDILVLGAAGKMGPTLTRMAQKASDIAGIKRKVIAVSRFSNNVEEMKFTSAGIETIRCDLLEPDMLSNLPDAANVIFMVGMKFGTTGQQALTWAVNSYLPGAVCIKYRQSKIVALSTGNVYGMVPVSGKSSVEKDELNPVGEYAMSALGRERVFEHFSRSYNIPTSLIRLNYACEPRYGVLVDIAQKVFAGQSVDVSMGYANVIWQRDANAMTLGAFAHTSVPPFALNVAGPEILSIREVSQKFAEIMGKDAQITGSENPDALLNDGKMGHELFGNPTLSSDDLIAMIAKWVMTGGASLGKPTHFESRDGKF